MQSFALLFALLLYLQNVLAAPADQTKPDTTSSAPSASSSALPKPTCATAGDAAHLSFYQLVATDNIRNFCSDAANWDKVIVPPISMGTGKTAHGQPKALGVDNSSPPHSMPSRESVWLSVSFADNGCMGSFNFTLGNNEAEKMKHCTDRFYQILTGCNTETIFGGTLIDQCALYTVVGSETKPASFTPGPNGKLKCVDTDTSAIGGASSPLSGTCTCSYSNSKAADVFKKNKATCAGLDPKTMELVNN